MADKFVYVAECEQCHKALGGVTQEEFNHLASQIGDGLCFDCEGDESSLVPKILEFGREGDLLDIDDLGFQFRNGALKCIGASRMSAGARSINSCLSSVTYLHKNPQNEVIWRDGRAFSDCKNCEGEGRIFYDGRFEPCGACETVGQVESAIVIPNWLIGGSCENV